jgi:hypothetical protein
MLLYCILKNIGTANKFLEICQSSNFGEQHQEISRYGECLILFSPELFVISLLPTDVKVKLHRIIILLTVLYGYETWCLRPCPG